jgi:hypothetical protein
MSAPTLEPIFARLRTILQKHAGQFIVATDTPHRYSLEGSVGPATLRAWGGTLKRRTIPVAWAEIGKSYVSFHLMAVAEGPRLRDALSTGLRARMQGKACFNFNTADESLFKELERVTARSLVAFRDAGFVVAQESR